MYAAVPATRAAASAAHVARRARRGTTAGRSLMGWRARAAGGGGGGARAAHRGSWQRFGPYTRCQAHLTPRLSDRNLSRESREDGAGGDRREPGLAAVGGNECSRERRQDAVGRSIVRAVERETEDEARDAEVEADGGRVHRD